MPSAINLPAVLQPKEEDIQMMLSAGVHTGTKNSDSAMRDYIWRRCQSGIHILNIGKTWEKCMLAARIITAIEKPEDVIAISARPYGMRAVLKFAHYTGSQSIAGRFTPGTFTNQITKQYREPRLLIVTDPRTDSQAVRESSYVNVPVIALCDSDSPLQYVDVAIPANNKGKHSIGLIYWFLAREVLRMRGSISRETDWDVPVDLFFHRDPEELKKADEEQQAKLDEAAAAEATPAFDIEMPTGGAEALVVDPDAYGAAAAAAAAGTPAEGAATAVAAGGFRAGAGDPAYGAGWDAAPEGDAAAAAATNW